MNWRNKLSLCFFPLLILFFFLVKGLNETPSVIPKTRQIASFPHKKIKRDQILDQKRIHMLRGKTLRHSLLRNRIPQSLGATFEKDSEVHLTRGYDFLKEIAVLPKEKYDSSLGEIVSQNEQFIFFKSQPGHTHIPVAISRTTNRLFPIASILHIKSVTPPMREELLAKGFKQYYYHPPLKLFSLETGPGQVMKVYNELLKQGYKVELEVLKPSHQTN